MSWRRPRAVPAATAPARGTPRSIITGHPVMADVPGVPPARATVPSPTLPRRRDLLAAGLREPEGKGDVRVRPYGYDRTVLEFHAPEGTAVVHVRSGEIRRFLQSTGELVPVGLEHLQLDLDHDLAELMRDAC